tara:strand:- start:104 stop:457 length:354 start_codon:yes stop_codon:yes gene_type:complete
MNMRKLLACLLISPIMLAKEYTFACVFTQNKDLVLSLLINTEDKYIFFGESDSPYNESWEETESSISAKKRESTTTYIAKFNKITGRFVYAGNYHPNYSSLDFELVYLCTNSNRLIP